MGNFSNIKNIFYIYIALLLKVHSVEVAPCDEEAVTYIERHLINSGEESLEGENFSQWLEMYIRVVNYRSFFEFFRENRDIKNHIDSVIRAYSSSHSLFKHMTCLLGYLKELTQQKCQMIRGYIHYFETTISILEDDLKSVQQREGEKDEHLVSRIEKLKALIQEYGDFLSSYKNYLLIPHRPTFCEDRRLLRVRNARLISYALEQDIEGTYEKIRYKLKSYLLDGNTSANPEKAIAYSLPFFASLFYDILPCCRIKFRDHQKCRYKRYENLLPLTILPKEALKTINPLFLYDYVKTIKEIWKYPEFWIGKPAIFASTLNLFLLNIEKSPQGASLLSQGNNPFLWGQALKNALEAVHIIPSSIWTKYVEDDKDLSIPYRQEARQLFKEILLKRGWDQGKEEVIK